MIPFYWGPEIDCENCIYWKRKAESGEMFCKEKHKYPEAYEHCEFQKNRYQWHLELMDKWLNSDAPTEEQKKQILIRREEFDRKNKKQNEIDQKRREEEWDIAQRGLKAVIRDTLVNND